ncbi:MAG: hypothetical protein LC118_12115 [Dehalococcoidia bacterium]|nr:hypothetical protein [Dehalococcoidia bacterium]
MGPDPTPDRPAPRRAAALLDGRTVPAPEDVTRVALRVATPRTGQLRAEADGITPDAVIHRLSP